MAELIGWSDRLSVGNDEIDEQHKKFLNLINALYIAKTQNQDTKYIERIIDELINYAKYHFTAEETLLAQNCFPKLTEHQAEHGEFYRWMSENRPKLVDYKSKREVSASLLNYLKGWLTSHILTSDKTNAYYLKKKTGK